MDREFEFLDHMVSHLVAVVLSDSRHLLRFCFQRDKNICRVFGPTTCHVHMTSPWKGVLGYVAAELSWELNDREVSYSFDHRRDTQYIEVFPRTTECCLHPTDSLCRGPLDIGSAERSTCNGFV